jgi:tetratricopeptide (TPR) repeat protein
MFVAIFFIFITVICYRSIQSLASRTADPAIASKTSPPRVAQLIDYADRLFRERKYLQSEKAYLEVLKINHKNVTAYSRLGMIYATLKNYDDAIECFQIACRLAPGGASFHNLGLVLYENRNYVKSIAAFEKAIMFEPSSLRYLGLAKAHQKMANIGKVVTALEKAADLTPDKKHLTLLAEAYITNKDRLKAQETYQRILEIDPSNVKARRFLDASTPATT